jgi:hypothetical protein
MSDIDGSFHLSQAASGTPERIEQEVYSVDNWRFHRIRADRDGQPLFYGYPTRPQKFTATEVRTFSFSFNSFP